MGLKSRLLELRPPYMPYRVEAWNNEQVFLRGLSISEFTEQHDLYRAEGANAFAVQAACVAHCIAEDDNGAPLFDDPSQMGNLPIAGLYDCYEEIVRRSSKAGHVETAKGN